MTGEWHHDVCLRLCKASISVVFNPIADGQSAIRAFFINLTLEKKHDHDC